MIKALTLILVLVFISSSLTEILVGVPLNLLEFLQWAWGYIPIALGLLILIWFLGD